MTSPDFSPFDSTALSLPTQLAAAAARRYPQEWRLLDAAWAATPNAAPDHESRMVHFWAETRELARAIGDDCKEAQLLYSTSLWSLSQGIYEFESDLLSEIIAHGPVGPVPASFFRFLPEPAVYIATPSLSLFHRPIAGFFATVFCHAGADFPDLYFTLVPASATKLSELLCFNITLTDESLGDIVARDFADDAYVANIRRFMDVRTPQMEPVSDSVFRELVAAGEPQQKLTEELSQCWNLALFLCSDSSRLEGTPAYPRRSFGMHTGNFMVPNDVTRITVARAYAESDPNAAAMLSAHRARYRIDVAKLIASLSRSNVKALLRKLGTALASTTTSDAQYRALQGELVSMLIPLFLALDKTGVGANIVPTNGEVDFAAQRRSLPPTDVLEASASLTRSNIKSLIDDIVALESLSAEADSLRFKTLFERIALAIAPLITALYKAGVVTYRDE